MPWQIYSYCDTLPFGNTEWVSEISFQHIRYTGKLVNSGVRSTMFNTAQIRNAHIALKRKIFLRKTFLFSNINYGFANIFINRHNIPPRQNHKRHYTTLPDCIESVGKFFLTLCQKCLPQKEKINGKHLCLPNFYFRACILMLHHVQCM